MKVAFSELMFSGKTVTDALVVKMPVSPHKDDIVFLQTQEGHPLQGYFRVLVVCHCHRNEL